MEKNKNSDSQKNFPKIDFSTFVLSLATSAQMQMGVLEHPQLGNIEVDLEQARQTIDILGILEAKTKGNLSEDESSLLGNILHDLHMIFVEKGKEDGGGGNIIIPGKE